MTIRDSITEVLLLQPLYSSANSEPMQRRGRVIRQELPNLLEAFRAELAHSIGISTNELLIEGRDGTGLKSEVPWVRFASRLTSPSATTGWYVVFLFRADGEGVYLALAHGSTQFNAGALIARSDSELAQLMSWSRGALNNDLVRHPRLTTNVDLATVRPLASSYEKSCVAAFYYQTPDLPEDGELWKDLTVMGRLLGRLHEAERLGQTPLSENPDVRAVEEVAAEIAKPLQGTHSQGFALTGSERRAVELHAMHLATAHLEQLGYEVRDVSSKGSFDLEAKLDASILKVEVKGSTGPLGSILLTSNEVELHKAAFPLNALILVHSIQLTRGTPSPTATGGILRCWEPWEVEDERLRGITFKYNLS